MERSKEGKFIIALDVGTTNLKCCLFSERMNIIRERNAKIDTVYSSDGAVEIIPGSLWELVLQSVRKLIIDAGISPSQIACFSISSQRNTFALWDRQTDKFLTNFVTWKDLRAADIISSWNNSLLFKVLKFIFFCLYLICGSQRFLCGSRLKFTSSQVLMRLVWTLRNDRKLMAAVKNGNAVFGTLDTWLLYRLTGGKCHCIDYSCASATGMFDPFTLSWTFLVPLLRLPTSMLPPVVDSAGTHFGCVCSDIWGAEIPITCCVADQSASTFGLRCSNRGDLKLTLGTGGFFSATVGETLVGSKNEKFYPLICWKFGNNKVCVLESAFNNCGTIIDWAHDAGYFDKVENLSGMAESVVDTKDIFLKINYFESRMLGKRDLTTTAFVGDVSGSEKAHLIRAILEAVVFQAYHLFLMYKAEPHACSKSTLRINGGVSNNDFVCQSIANICQIIVSRPSCTETSVRGAALLGGNAAGLFDINDVVETGEQIFHPDDVAGRTLRSRFAKWAKYQV